MRVVVDTNVLVSGIFWKGLPALVLDQWHRRKFEWLISTDILDEYYRVAEELHTEYPAIEIQPILDLITQGAHLVAPRPGPVPACDDPDDRMFLAAAVSGKAQFIVSGDKALLRVSTYPGGKVVTVKQFLALTT